MAVSLCHIKGVIGNKVDLCVLWKQVDAIQKKNHKAISKIHKSMLDQIVFFFLLKSLAFEYSLKTHILSVCCYVQIKFFFLSYGSISNVCCYRIIVNCVGVWWLFSHRQGREKKVAFLDVELKLLCARVFNQAQKESYLTEFTWENVMWEFKINVKKGWASKVFGV